MKNDRFTVAILALLSFVALPFLAPLRATAADMGSDHAKGTIHRLVATVGSDGIQHVDVIGGSYYFDPNDIVVKVNVPVELQVKKESGFVPHDIVAKAPEAGIDFKLDLKSEFQTIRFTPTKIGKYAFYCDKKLLWFASHREKGMEGLIEVVE